MRVSFGAAKFQGLGHFHHHSRSVRVDAEARQVTRDEYPGSVAYLELRLTQSYYERLQPSPVEELEGGLKALKVMERDGDEEHRVH